MTECCFPMAQRIHRAVQRAPSYADTSLLGQYSVLDLKKFSVYNPPFQIKILFDHKLLSKYKLFFATAHQKCTLPSRAVQPQSSYTRGAIWNSHKGINPDIFQVVLTWSTI